MVLLSSIGTHSEWTIAATDSAQVDRNFRTNETARPSRRFRKRCQRVRIPLSFSQKYSETTATHTLSNAKFFLSNSDILRNREHGIRRRADDGPVTNETSIFQTKYRNGCTTPQEVIEYGLFGTEADYVSFHTRNSRRNRPRVCTRSRKSLREKKNTPSRKSIRE